MHNRCGINSLETILNQRMLHTYLYTCILNSIDTIRLCVKFGVKFYLGLSIKSMFNAFLLGIINMYCTLLFNIIINFGNMRKSKYIFVSHALRWNYLLWTVVLIKNSKTEKRHKFTFFSFNNCIEIVVIRKHIIADEISFVKL